MLLARHADRPYTLDFVERLFEDFVELHGDKRFAEDPAIVCGLAKFHGLPVIVVGHQKVVTRNSEVIETLACLNLRAIAKLFA